MAEVSMIPRQKLTRCPPLLTESITMQGLMKQILQQNDSDLSIGSIIVTSDILNLSDLPEEIQALDSGMNSLPALKEAPMRFLKLDSFLSWSSLKVFEEVPESDRLEIPYSRVSEDIWSKAAVLSWRWDKSKPWRHTYEEFQAAPFSPMSHTQLAELQSMIRNLKSSNVELEYIWVDWCGVPQYLLDPIIEILRSKVFYARSRIMLVLPTFGPLPDQAVLCALIGLVKTTLSHRSTLKASVLVKCIAAIESKKRLACRDYFARVWTLAERMARFGRNERLCNWLTLEAWVGMLIDAFLRSAGDETSITVYLKILGPQSKVMMKELVPLLQSAIQSGSLASHRLQEVFSDLLELGADAWLPSINQSSLVEAPNKAWLKTYLGKEAISGCYNAWRQEDRVWAILSYFCWSNVTDRSEAELRNALELLCEIVGDEREAREEGMFVQLQLESNTEGWTPLHRACSKGRTEAVRSLLLSLSDKAELEQKDKAGLTPLHLAVKNAHKDAASILIKSGADTEAQDKEGRTPLLSAFERGDRPLVKLLARSGANVNIRSKDHKDKTMLIMCAEKGDVVMLELLIKAGADKEAKDSLSRTPLICACESGNAEAVEAVKKLIEAGANIEAQDAAERTPIICAVSEKVDHIPIVTLLIKAGARVEARDRLGRSALSRACERGHLPTVDLLIKASADIEAKDNDGATPLWYACSQGHADVTDLLIKLGADLKSRKADGSTPLLAASSSHVQIVDMLIKSGANVEDKDNHDRTPLVLASEVGCEGAVQLLLAAGASMEARQEDGRSPLQCACKHGHVSCARILLQAGADKEVKDKKNNTPLAWATREGENDCVELLLQAGVNTEAKGEHGRTPLLWASMEGHEIIVRMLLEAGANKDASSNYGSTALIWASRMGHEGIIALLIKAGANKNAKDKEKSALDYAMQNGFTRIIEMLQV